MAIAPQDRRLQPTRLLLGAFAVAVAWLGFAAETLGTDLERTREREGGQIQAAAAPSRSLDDHGASSRTREPRIRRVLQRPPLWLSAPTLEAPLLSGLPCELQVEAHYSGAGVVSYSLVSGPAGMVIDSQHGVLTWTPPEGAEGSEHPISVSATDGENADEVTFSVVVAAPSPVATTLSGPTLTVTGAGSLQGVAFDFPTQTSVALSGVSVGIVPADQAPPLPGWLTTVGDFFRVTPVAATGEDDTITAVLPPSVVPSGSDPEDLRLLVYTDSVTNLDEPTWVPTWTDLDVRPDGSVTLELRELGELCVLAVDGRRPDESAAVAATAASGSPQRARAGGLDFTISCTRKELANGSLDSRQGVCSVTGDTTMTVTVKDLWSNQWSPKGTHETLLGWLAAAKASLESRGLVASPVFEVAVEPLAPGKLGYVSKVENRRVLHLSAAARPLDRMQVAAVHEFFHHAQSRTRIAGLGNLMNSNWKRKWLTEGTAVWFQDWLFESLDSYKWFRPSPLAPVLSRGLVKPWRGDALAGKYDAYGLFMFFTMLDTYCPGMTLRNALNCDLATDPGCLQSLAALLETTAWQCDFGDGFGAANRATLGSALLYYLYATQKLNDVTLLDPSESGYGFQGPTRSITPSPDCEPPLLCPSTAETALSGMAPAAGVAFEVAPVENLAADREAVLELDIHEAPVWVWVSNDEANEGLAGGDYFDRAGTFELTYGQDGRAPRLFVAVVNPSPSESAGRVDFWARVQERAPVETTFSTSTTCLDNYNPLMYDVKWAVAGSGNVTAPAGVSVTTPSPKAESVYVRVGGTASPPFTVTISGTLDVTPDNATGKVRKTDTTYGTYDKEWAYTNMHLHLDYPDGARQQSNSFSYTVQCDALPCSREIWSVVEYDLDYTLTYPDGTVFHEARPRAEVKGAMQIKVSIRE